MILFEDDWATKYPRAIVDDTTTNESFIRYAALLKKMGVRNHLWPLQLHNPEIRGWDPHDPTLSPEQMLLILEECKHNFMYFLRECVRIPGSTLEYPIRFIANRGIMSLYWSFMNHVTYILIMPRQVGKSFGVDVLLTWVLNTSTDTAINLLTKDDTLRTANLSRLRSIEAELPFYLRFRKKTDPANTERMVISRLNNTYEGHLPQKNPAAADKVGRGLTSPITQVDEAAYFDNIAISLPVALSSGSRARETARMRGTPYGTILTTTAGRKDSRDGSFVYNLVVNSAVWSEQYYDLKDRETLYQVIRTNSKKDSTDISDRGRGSLRINGTFNHRQLGYTDKWLLEKLEESGSHGELADRDYGNVWTSGNTLNPLTIEQLEVIKNSEDIDVTTEITSDNYMLRWYLEGGSKEQLMSSGQFIMSVDTSDAVGGDDIGVHIRDVKDGRTVAAGDFNETNLIVFAQWLADMIIKYPTITLIIERRSSAIVIIDYLLLILPSKGINPFKRLYNTVVQNKSTQPQVFEEVDRASRSLREEVFVKHKKSFGFATSGSGLTSRQGLYNETLRNAVKLTSTMVKDKKIIDQLMDLEDNGTRIDHAPGGNDDMVITWLLSYWLLIRGENLEYYGIRTRDILVDNEVNRVEYSPEKVHESHRQDQLRQSIVDTVEELRAERDSFKAYRLEHKLKVLSEQLTEDDRRLLSVSDLIEDIRSRKVTNRYRNR